MTIRSAVAEDEQTLTVRVPMVLRKRGGQKMILAPEGVTRSPPRLRIDNAMIKSLARAFRWRKLMETGAYATVAEIAAAERVNDSYVSRILRLTLLAPDIVEAVIDGRQGPTMTVQTLTQPFTVEWDAQRHDLGAAGISVRCVDHHAATCPAAPRRD